MSVRTDWDLLSSYAGLLGLAATIIYSGSYESLPVREVLDVTEAAPSDRFSLSTHVYLFAIVRSQKTRAQTLRKTAMTKNNLNVCLSKMHGYSPL